MAKRSAFERRAGDAYPTPIEAVLPLIPHLRACATSPNPARAMVRSYAISNPSACAAPIGDIATGQDALACDSFGGVPIITNPPWRRDQLLR